ncbi:MAG TPA: hypothetical protein VKJ65_09215 [Phycisphaerae bacterium]|nr:hypothetical protein [Phycisphaerae bacterium]
MTSDILLAIFTLGLMLSTIWLAVATHFLVVGAEKNAQRQLRAYIGISEQTADIESDHIKPLRFKITIHNYGSTPAHDVVVKIDVSSICTFDTKVSFDHLVGLKKGTPKSIMFPGKDVPYWHYMMNTSIYQAMAEVGQNAKVIFVFGCISYKDIFGEEHDTKFRSMFSRESVHGGGGLLVCDEGNEAT